MTGLQFEKGMIVLACWRAGASEGVLGMIAIACEIRNLAAAGLRESDHYLNALTLPEMKSGGEPDLQGLFPDPRDPELIQFMNSLDNVLAGRTKDPTDGGFFHRHANQEPYHHSMALERTASVGKLNFYR